MYKPDRNFLPIRTVAPACSLQSSSGTHVEDIASKPIERIVQRLDHFDSFFFFFLCRDGFGKGAYPGCNVKFHFLRIDLISTVETLCIDSSNRCIHRSGCSEVPSPRAFLNRCTTLNHCPLAKGIHELDKSEYYSLSRIC